MSSLRSLLRYYLPPASVWASAPAHFLGGVWAGRLAKALPAGLGVLSALALSWWSTARSSLDFSSLAFLAPLVGLVVGLLSMVFMVLLDSAAEWLHTRWGSAPWSEAPHKVRHSGLRVLQGSALARAQAQRWLRREPEGLLRARHLVAIQDRSWPDYAPGVLGGTGVVYYATGMTDIPAEMERLEKLRRRSRHLSKTLPPAAPPSRRRTRF